MKIFNSPLKKITCDRIDGCLDTSPDALRARKATRRYRADPTPENETAALELLNALDKNTMQSMKQAALL